MATVMSIPIKKKKKGSSTASLEKGNFYFCLSCHQAKNNRSGNTEFCEDADNAPRLRWREKSGQIRGASRGWPPFPRSGAPGAFASSFLFFLFLVNSSCSDLWSFVFDPTSQMGLGTGRTLAAFVLVGFVVISKDQGRVRVLGVAKKHRVTVGGSQRAQRWPARELGPQHGSLYLARADAQTEPRAGPRGFGALAETLGLPATFQPV